MCSSVTRVGGLTVVASSLLLFHLFLHPSFVSGMELNEDLSKTDIGPSSG